MNTPGIAKSDGKPTAEEIEKCAISMYAQWKGDGKLDTESIKDLWQYTGQKDQFRTCAKIHLTHLSTITKERDAEYEVRKFVIHALEGQGLPSKLPEKGFGVIQDAYKLRTECDNLRTQLELEQSKVARCVEVIKRHDYSDLSTEHIEAQCDDRAKQTRRILNDLTTTPNLAARVRELEEALKATVISLDTLKTFHRHSPTWNLVYTSEALEKAQSTLNPNNKGG